MKEEKKGTHGEMIEWTNKWAGIPKVTATQWLFEREKQKSNI